MNTYEVLDWMEEIENEPRFVLTCPACYGEDAECEHCGGRGYIVPQTSRVWVTTLKDVNDAMRLHLLDYDVFAGVDSTTGYVVIASLSKSDDMIPRLAAAWLALGNYTLPLEWIDRLVRLGGKFIGASIGEETAQKIRRAACETLLKSIDVQQKQLYSLIVEWDI